MSKQGNMLLSAIPMVMDEDGEKYIPTCEICHVSPSSLICEKCGRRICGLCSDVMEYPGIDWWNWQIWCIACQEEEEEQFEDSGDCDDDDIEGPSSDWIDDLGDYPDDEW